MGTIHSSIVLAAVEPQKLREVAELLKEELTKKISGAVPSISEITGNGSAQEIVREILFLLEKSGMIAASADEPVYSAEEEIKIRKRLEDLGYL